MFAHSARHNYSSQPLGCQGHEIVLSPMHSTMNRKSPGNGMRTLFLAALPSPWLPVGPWQSGSTVDIIQRHQKIRWRTECAIANSGHRLSIVRCHRHHRSDDIVTTMSWLAWRGLGRSAPSIANNRCWNAERCTIRAETENEHRRITCPPRFSILCRQAKNVIMRQDRRAYHGDHGRL